VTGPSREPDSRFREPVAAVIARGYAGHAERFCGIVARATERFAKRQWTELHEDALALIDLYNDSVQETLQSIRDILGEAINERARWGPIRDQYAALTASRSDPEIAATFFNSITRRVFATVGIDAEVEFASIVPVAAAPAPIRLVAGNTTEVIGEALEGAGLPGMWKSLNRDVRLAAAEVAAFVHNRGETAPIHGAEILDQVFYRGQGAYIVGRINAGGSVFPIAFCVHHTSRGLLLGSVLTEPRDISVLFSYTRSAFHVRCDEPAATVDYLQTLMPTKRRAELYSTIGYRKHAKTELYSDLMRHVASTDERFEHARGIKGMVMIVFTMPGFDVVFKVIRDRFPYPKQTTRRQIMAKYRLVFRHDRAGRLIDAQEFEQLHFDKSRFSAELLAELAADAARSVTIGDSSVTLHHVYVERRVIPLDIYVREANPVKARAAIVDYGRAIKNLAATNIFPGDMLLKNFGMTRGGRVVFYDYDEITELTKCKFREMPDTDNPHDEMSATAWFGVGDNDVFPEEFARFLGLREELREVFNYNHSDLFGVRFWQRAQDRVRRGETIEIFPYERSRRLGATRPELTREGP
jgi:isocitrate dehydrogenase kinase/phosphatase